MANAVADLLGEKTQSARRFFGRYALLIGYPHMFYERHIKDKGKAELKVALRDAGLVIAVLVAIIGMFLYIPGLSQLLPDAFESIITSKNLLLASLLALSLPTFLIHLLGMRWMGAPSQDAVFIFLFSFTLLLAVYVLMFIGGVVFNAILALLLFAFFDWESIGSISSSWGSVGIIVGLLLASILLYGAIAVLFYVPCRMIELSANSSTFAAAIALYYIRTCPDHYLRHRPRSLFEPR